MYDHGYCGDTTCGFGDRDCDIGQCKEDLECGSNNFLDIHPKLKECGLDSQEVCVYKDLGKILKLDLEISFTSLDR